MLRKLFQDHLDLRGAGPALEPVVGDDGIEWTHRRVRSQPQRVGQLRVEGPSGDWPALVDDSLAPGSGLHKKRRCPVASPLLWFV